MVANDPDEALKRAHDSTSYAVGYCLRWVRERWEVGSLFASAIEAWEGARFKHPGDRNPPDGAPLFYRGGQYGHLVIGDYPDHDGMRSTDCHSSGDVSDAAISWVESHWGYTYLGWTEDLNGVSLPLNGDDDMNEKDWDRMTEIVRTEVARVWDDHMTVTAPGSGSDQSKAREQVLRELWQKVTRAT